MDQYDGQNFIAMEFLEGHTLKNRITGRPIDLERVPQYGHQMADAVEAAHANNIATRTGNRRARFPPLAFSRLFTQGEEDCHCETRKETFTNCFGKGLIRRESFVTPECAGEWSVISAIL